MLGKKRNKKCFGVFAVCLALTCMLSVIAVYAASYEETYSKYFSVNPTPAGTINRVYAYIAVPSGVTAGDVDLDTMAYVASGSSPAYYCVGCYETESRLPWSNRNYSAITSEEDMMTLIGDQSFNRGSVTLNGTTHTFANSGFDMKRVSWTKLAYGVDAAMTLDDKSLYSGGAVWHIDGVADKFIVTFVDGNDTSKEYVKVGENIKTPSEVESKKHFDHWDCDVDVANGMPAKDITMTAVYSDHDSVVDKGKAATCTEDGLTDGAHCAICGEILTEQEVIKAKGHQEVIDKAVEPTTTTTGLTEGIHCEVCGTVLKEQEEIPMIEEDPEDPDDGDADEPGDGELDDDPDADCNNDSDDGDISQPKTGDEAHIYLGGFVLVLSILTMGVLVSLKKRKEIE